MKRISLVLSEWELKEMLRIVKHEGEGTCIVLNGPIRDNGPDSIIHYGQSDIWHGSEVVKKAGEYFKP